ncbi:MAG: hypothetical protein H7Z14_16580 [Anaerolineae bacterium]|nr:hypothetical protein [Phycisphaerae bacterium]
MNLNKRNVCVMSAVLCAMAVGGCQRIHDIPPDALDDTPIQVDPAMARREWEETRATYPNTGIRTTPTLYTFQSPDNRPNYQYALIELPLFITNGVLIPYQLFAAPVWKEREYRAATIPPSYSAMPVLPPSNEAESDSPTPSEGSGQPMPAPAERPADQPAPR